MLLVDIYPDRLWYLSGESLANSSLWTGRCLGGFLYIQPVSSHSTQSPSDQDLGFDSFQDFPILSFKSASVGLIGNVWVILMTHSPGPFQFYFTLF